jgi:hypothetical protein
MFSVLLSVLVSVYSLRSKEGLIKTLKASIPTDGERLAFYRQGVCYNPIPIGKTHDYDSWNDPPAWSRRRADEKDGRHTVRFYQPRDLAAAAG